MAIEKSKAEQYRDERKARIAEAAKKNAKDMQKKNATKKVVKKIVSVVIVLAIVLGVVAATMNYYGAWDRTLTAGHIGEHKFSIAEYEYNYWVTYNELVNEASSNYSTGSYYGFDATLSPEEQTTTAEDKEGNPISWVEFIRLQALDRIKQTNLYYEEAKKLELDTLTAADEKQIDDIVESLREQAKGASSASTANGQQGPKYSLNAYLRMNFGEYMNESFLRKIMEKEIIAQKFVDHRLEQVADGYDQAVVDKKYAEDKSAYDVVDFRIYEFTKGTLTAESGESNDALKKRQEEADAKTKKDADDFLAAITDEASFIAKAKELNKDTKDYDVDASTKLTNRLKSEIANISKDFADWAFKADTKVDSKKMFTSSDGKAYYVILITATPHQVETISVRHILFTNSDATTGAKLSDEEIAQKKKDAEAVLAEWKNGDKTEDSFAALAAEHTEDTGSAQNGGLYENVRPGQMVPEFNDWCFDKNRKAGDVEIVETDYGYHVMYFVSNDGKYYDSTIRVTLANQDVTAELEDLTESDTYKIEYGPRSVKFAENKMNKQITTLLAQQANQSSYGY